MRFWDSSAVIFLLAGQSGEPELRGLLDEDPDAVLWWGTPIEMVSAACRLRRNGSIDDRGLALLTAEIEEFASSADRINPTEQVRQGAVRALRVHDLRTADALQLAAALAWTEQSPAGAGFVCLDSRLRAAAEREGFAALPAAATAP